MAELLSAPTADRAMGLELEANDLEVQLEWAEHQGRGADADRLWNDLTDVLVELADVVEEGFDDGAPVIDAPHAA